MIREEYDYNSKLTCEINIGKGIFNHINKIGIAEIGGYKNSDIVNIP